MKGKLLILLIVISTHLLFGGDSSRKGTSGADQLLIPVGAKSVATGGAFVANVKGVESIYYNPGGLDLMGGTEAMFSYMNYFADVKVSYFAVASKLDIGSIGFSFKTLDFGDIPVTTFQNPDGTGQTFSPNFLVAGLTYSKGITDRISAGVTFNLISETIMNTSATGAAIDFGVQYRFKNNLSLGVAVKNIGTNMSYSGEDLKFKTDVPDGSLGSGTGVYEVDTEEFQIPSYFEMSLAYVYDLTEDNKVSIASTFRNNNMLEDQFKFGFRYEFMDALHLSAGYDYLLENSDEATYGLSLGAGVNYSLVEGINLAFDYAYRSAQNFPTDNHLFTVTLGLE